jgi:hypothetical protein
MWRQQRGSAEPGDPGRTGRRSASCCTRGSTAGCTSPGCPSAGSARSASARVATGPGTERESAGSVGSGGVKRSASG